MKCINCNQEIDDGNKFCNFCGTMQPLDREAYEKEHPNFATAMTNQPANSNPSPLPPQQGTPMSPPTGVPGGEAIQAKSNNVYVVPQPPIAGGNNSTDSGMMQCPDCGRMIPKDSLFCPHCRCPFVDPSEQYHEDSRIPVPPAPSHRETPLPQKPKDKGMSGWAKALLTLSIIMMLGAIAGGVYYFLFYNKVDKFRPDDDMVTFSRNGGEKTVTFTTDAKEFSVTKHPEWVIVTTGNKEITIICQPLESYEDREGTIKLKAGDKEAKITVKQSAIATYLRLSQDIIKIGYNGEEVPIEIDTDGAPSSIDYYIDDYFMCSLTDKSNAGFTARIEENTYPLPRECSITITSGNQERKLTIIQAGMCANCMGTGKEPCYSCDGEGHNDCSNCNGTGLLYNLYNNEYIKCEYCEGRGTFPCEDCDSKGYNTCEQCNGTGNNFTREESF